MRDHSFIDPTHNEDLRQFVAETSSSNLEEPEETPSMSRKKLYQRARLYRYEFSHLVKLIEKIKKPSEETSATVSLLIELVSDRFKRPRKFKGSYSKSKEWILANMGRVLAEIEDFPGRFKDGDYKRIDLLHLHFIELIETG